MPSSRAISRSLLATSVGQSKETSPTVQPKPAASSISCLICEPITNSFFGTQPRITQAPPLRYSSATMTLAPWPAAMRAARTPPEPPPMTNRSTSNSAMATPLYSPSPRSLRRGAKNERSGFLAALPHLATERGVDGFGKHLRPLVHIGHRELDGARFAREQFLAERRLVERHQILQFLLGEFVGIDLCHALADFLFAAGQVLGDDDGDLVEVFLIVEVGLQQRVLGLLDDVGNGVGVHRARVLHRQDLLGGGDRGPRGFRRRDGLLLRLRQSGRRRQRQSQSHACSRQNSRKTLHSNSPK